VKNRYFTLIVIYVLQHKVAGNVKGLCNAISQYQRVRCGYKKSVQSFFELRKGRHLSNCSSVLEHKSFVCYET